MIKTKSIYKPVGEEDGLRVLITRYYPRGVKRERYDIWVRELAPSAELLRRYKNSEIQWSDFSAILLSELRGSINSVEAIHALQTAGLMQDITLLCHEKDGCPCHRHMVRDLIEDPTLLQSNLVPENTDNQKSAMSVHVSGKKAMAMP